MSLNTLGAVVPSSTILNFTDPIPTNLQLARQGSWSFCPWTREIFATLTKIKLHRLWMQRSDASLPQILHGTLSVELAVIGFLTDSDQPECRPCGTNVFPGDITRAC